MEGRAAPPAVTSLLAGWHRTECAIAVAAFTFIALLLIVDVAGRELAWPLLRALGLQPGAMGIWGAPKLALHALVIGIFAGIGIAAASSAHLVPRVGFALIPERWMPLVTRLGDAVTAVVLGAAAWYAAVFVAGTRASGMLVPMLQWPAWPVQCAIPAGFASAALRYAIFAAWPQTRPAPRD